MTQPITVYYDIDNSSPEFRKEQQFYPPMLGSLVVTEKSYFDTKGHMSDGDDYSDEISEALEQCGCEEEGTSTFALLTSEQTMVAEMAKLGYIMINDPKFVQFLKDCIKQQKAGK